MKNIFKNIITWQKDDYITFNLFVAAIITVLTFVIFRSIKETTLNTTLIILLWFTLIIGINYITRRISKKYIVEIPEEKDCECDGYLLKTKNGEAFKMDEKWIWSENGKLYKIKSNGPNKRGTWIRILEEKVYLFPINIGEFVFEKYNEEFFILLFMEEGFNPVEIYKIYQENNIPITDDCLYIEDALREAIIKLNEDNEKLKNIGLHINENFLEAFRSNLLIPKFNGVKKYDISRKKTL